MADGKAKVPNCMRCGTEKFVELPYRTAAGMAPYLLLCCAGCLAVVSGARKGDGGAMDRPLALWKNGFDPKHAQQVEGRDAAQHPRAKAWVAGEPEPEAEGRE